MNPQEVNAPVIPVSGVQVSDVEAIVEVLSTSLLQNEGRSMMILPLAGMLWVGVSVNVNLEPVST